MRSYEIEASDGTQCYVIASNIDHAQELVTEQLGLSTKDYFRGSEPKVSQEPCVFVKTRANV